MSVLIPISHPELIQQTTRLSADIAAAATSATVDNTEGFATNDYIVAGDPGIEKSEIILLTGVTAPDTLTFSGGATFAHLAKTKIGKIQYNQIEISSASSEDGSYSVLDTIDINIDEQYTTYEDTTGSDTDWYKVRFKNENASTYSGYSDALQGTGYTEDSLYSMTEEVLADFNDKQLEEISREDVRRWLRAGVRKVISSLMMSVPDYRRQYGSQALTSGTATYNLPNRFLAFSRVDINYTGSNTDGASKAEMIDEGKQVPGSNYSTNEPYFAFRGEQIVIKPTPTTTGGYIFWWYWDAPVVMTNDTDEHGLPYGARDLLVSYGLLRAHRKVRDFDALKSIQQDLSSQTEDLISLISSKRALGNNQFLQATYGSELYEG